MNPLRWLLILLVTLALGVTGAAAQGIDTDDDGVPFRRDNCPNEAGPAEINGCPFNLVIVPAQVDTDGDGLPDSDDQCPTVSGIRENGGCPPTDNPPPNDPDTDADGTPDSGDDCPAVPGPRENRGCPPADNPPSNPDTDGDGLPDSDDQCPTVSGIRENGGCPPTDNPPPNDPPSTVPDSSVPPFGPPSLPTDGCFVTPANGNQINVRKAPNLGADIVGFLLPGVVYAAQGYVLNGADNWFVLSVYETSSGDTGYASRSVLLASTCAELPDTATVPPAQSGLTSEELDQPPLCHLTVGFDAPTWSDNPAMPSVPYASFWIASLPGEPIPAGTPIWGVISVEDFIILTGADNAIAVATDPAVMNAALNDPAGGGVYNWPTAHGGIEVGSTRLYRLSGEQGGSCGPISSVQFDPADDFAQEGDGPGVVQAMECFPQPGTTLVESCWCESSDSDCVQQLVAICKGGMAYVDAGPDMTACWWADDGSVGAWGRQLALYMDQAAVMLSICSNDLSVWWIELPSLHDAPSDLLDPSQGYCDNLDDVLDDDLPTGTTRLVAKRGDGVVDPTPPADCNENGIPDADEVPRPGCSDLTTVPDGNEARKETVPWWTEVMNLMCPGNWIIMIETDADGDEVVTDAQCDD